MPTEKIIEVPGFGNIAFPESMPDADIARQIQGIVRNQEVRTRQADPNFRATASYDLSTRSPGMVASDQAAEVLRGIPEAITGIPGAVKSLGRMVVDQLTGNRVRAAQRGAEMLGGTVSPLVTVGHQATELMAPGMVDAPSPDDPRTAEAARFAGTSLGGAIAAPLGARVLGAAATSASAARPPISRRLMEGASRTSRKLERAPPASLNIPVTRTQALGTAARAAVQPVRRAKVAIQTAIAKRLDPEYVETRSPQALAVASEDEWRRMATRNQEIPSAPADPDFIPPILEAPGVSAANQAFLDNLRTQAPAPVNLRSIETAIAPGRSTKFSQLFNADGTPTRYGADLLDAAPELAGVTAETAPARLMTAFERAGNAVGAAEEAVPRTFTVPKAAVVDRLKQLHADYEASGIDRAARAVESVLEKWDALPEQISWEVFRDLKRGFAKEYPLRSAPNRRMYGILMEAASPASKALAAANRAYHVVLKALTDGKIDIYTGRRMGPYRPPR